MHARFGIFEELSTMPRVKIFAERQGRQRDQKKTLKGVHMRPHAGILAIIVLVGGLPNSALALHEPSDHHPCIPPLVRALHYADANEDGQVTFEELSELVPELTQEIFDSLDANHDGVLTVEDVTLRARRFHRLLNRLREADANGDCSVDLEEFLAGFPDATQEHFDRLDRNDDGLLDGEDCLPVCWPDDLPCLPPLLRVLRLADENDDGQVTFDELSVLLPDLTQELFDRLDANDDGVLTVEDAGPRVRRYHRLLRRLHEADTNGDCSVDLEEFLAAFPDATEERFDRLDRNNDGLLNRADCLPICWPDDEGGTPE
jgi:Ca2+-binding EF-hand superfamily protein